MGDFLVSADSHMVEPPDLFTSRLPYHLRDRALRLEYLPEVIKLTLCDGYATPAGMQMPKESAMTSYLKQDVDWYPGDGSAPAERTLQDMYRDGISATVLHCNAALTAVFQPDHELAMAHARVLNDYASDAYLAHADRIAPMAFIPLTDVDDAVAEIDRAAHKGFRGIGLPIDPPTPYYTNTYERVWAAAQANGMVATFHIGTSSESNSPHQLTRDAPIPGDIDLINAFEPTATPDAPLRAAWGRRFIDQENITAAPRRAVMSLVGSGVPDRFPQLHFVFVETNAYWLSALMGAMDKAVTLGIGQNLDEEFGTWSGDVLQMVKRFVPLTKWPYPQLPSDYVRRQVHVCFMDDPMAIACRHITGVETILWGNDYPHPEGTYPRSQEAVDHLFSGVDPAERAAILGGTTAKLFGFKVPPRQSCDSLGQQS